MNTIDICRLCINIRDFRFKARVWECRRPKQYVRLRTRLHMTRGSNNEILRQTPRYNPEVNEYWMCDVGRLTVQTRERANRIKSPMIKRTTSWWRSDGIKPIVKAASEFKGFKKSEIAVIDSVFRYDTNEDNYLLQKFATDVLERVTLISSTYDRRSQDDILIRADKTPNTLGAAIVVSAARRWTELDSIIKGIKEGLKAL